MSASAAAPYAKVEVQAAAVLSIIDHHMRKAAGGGGRVIGTLMGVHRAGTASIEVTGAYAVPHVDKEREVAIGKDFNAKMKTLWGKSHPGEVVVGWYTTGSQQLDAKTCLIHDYYSTLMATGASASPVLLVVDASGKAAALEAYYSVALGAGGRALAAEFRPLVVEPSANGPERIALAALLGGGSSSSTSSSLDRLGQLVDQASALISSSSSNASPEVVQRVAELVNQVDVDSSDKQHQQLAKSLQDAIHDLSMVVQLAQLARTQLAVNEKLTSSSSSA